MGQIHYERRLMFQEIEINDKDGWAVDYYHPVLFHIDMDTLEMKPMCFLPSDNIGILTQYTMLKYYDGKLIIAPFNAKELVIYNLRCGEIEKTIDISEFVMTEVNQLFADIQIVGNCAYLIPGRSHVIIQLNLNNYSVTAIDGWYEKIEKYHKEKGRIICRRAMVTDDDGLCLPLFQSGCILSIDIRTFDAQVHELGDTPFSTVVRYRDHYIFSCRDDAALIFYSDTWQKEKEISIPDEYMFEGGISKMILSGHDLFVFPRNGDSVLKYKILSGEFEQVHKLPMEYTYKDGVLGEVSCHGMTKHGNTIYFISVRDGRLCCYHIDERRAETKELMLSNESRKFFVRNLKGLSNDDADLTTESYYNDLKDFIYSL